MGQETLHPLVSVVDFSRVPPLRHVRKAYGFYAVFLKDLKCGDLRYGRHYYDYQEGTLVFVSPGQVLGNDDNGEYFRVEGYALLFHPDLLRGTSLGRRMKDYTFFSYDASESLHMSERERNLFLNGLTEIREELERGVDRHTKSIVTANIEVLLNHCMRFYDRQFITRENVNRDVLTEFERLLDSYFEETSLRNGVCPMCSISRMNCISPPTISVISSRKRREKLPRSISISSWWTKPRSSFAPPINPLVKSPMNWGSSIPIT